MKHMYYVWQICQLIQSCCCFGIHFKHDWYAQNISKTWLLYPGSMVQHGFTKHAQSLTNVKLSLNAMAAHFVFRYNTTWLFEDLKVWNEQVSLDQPFWDIIISPRFGYNPMLFILVHATFGINITFTKFKIPNIFPT